jgi:putative NADPH-quinone reductase
MNWLEPSILHGAHDIDHAALASHAANLRARLEHWLASKVGASETATRP